ncbi:MAG: hypothetical protein WA476_12515 [Acidobacteriaceae bacterium]
MPQIREERRPWQKVALRGAGLQGGRAVGNNPLPHLNRMAVQALLADAERVLALSDVGDVGGSHEVLTMTVENARHNYHDMIRRRKPLMLTETEEERFQDIMARLQARIRLYEQSA